MKRESIAESLRRAYERAPACPPPETFLDEAWRALPASERHRIEEHAKACPACSAERDLARAFEASADDDVRNDDVAHVVSSLMFAPGAQDRIVPFVAGRERPPVRSTLRWWLAAAALFVAVVATVTTYRSPAPGLPSREGDGTLRGAVVEAEVPVGEVATLPEALRWTTVDGATSYRVRISSADGTVLWESSARESAVDLPADIRGGMHAAVVYTWEVDALDSQGFRIASSGPVRFRAKPRAYGQGGRAP